MAAALAAGGSCLAGSCLMGVAFWVKDSLTNTKRRGKGSEQPSPLRPTLLRRFKNTLSSPRKKSPEAHLKREEDFSRSFSSAADIADNDGGTPLNSEISQTEQPAQFQKEDQEQTSLGECPASLSEETATDTMPSLESVSNSEAPEGQSKTAFVADHDAEDSTSEREIVEASEPEKFADLNVPQGKSESITTDPHPFIEDGGAENNKTAASSDSDKYPDLNGMAESITTEPRSYSQDGGPENETVAASDSDQHPDSNDKAASTLEPRSSGEDSSVDAPIEESNPDPNPNLEAFDGQTEPTTDPRSSVEDSNVDAQIEVSNPDPYPNLDAQPDIAGFEKTIRVGNIFYKSELMEECVRWFDKGIWIAGRVEVPSDRLSILYQNRAIAQLNLELWEDALASCEEALQLNPLNNKAQYGTAIAQLELGRFRESWSALDKLSQAITGTSNPLVQSVKKLRLEILEAKRAEKQRADSVAAAAGPSASAAPLLVPAPPTGVAVVDDAATSAASSSNIINSSSSSSSSSMMEQKQQKSLPPDQDVHAMD